MNIGIISTYPINGSQNIGDALITHSIKEAISSFFKEKIIYHTFWREDSWENISTDILKCNFVIFACLAIRYDMLKTYPYIEKIISSKIPFGIISAGTSLKINSNSFIDNISKHSIKILKKLDNSALFFSTRGILTNTFCKKIGLKNTRFTGDIAFFDLNKKNKNKPINNIKNIKNLKIAISDPHYSEFYIDTLHNLIIDLPKIFPKSTFELLLHGKNDLIIKYANKFNIKYYKLYNKKGDISKLNKYDDFDIHIGFRVHGHVTMLKKLRPSYLLEQDGRGFDYGLTILPRCSIKCDFKSIRRINNLENWVYDKNNIPKDFGINCIDYFLELIKQDKKCNFNKFSTIDRQIKIFNKENLNLLKKIPLTVLYENPKSKRWC